MTKFIVILVLIFVSFSSEHVVIEVKIILESIWHEHIVHILSQVHSHIDLVAELVLFFLIKVAFLRGNAASKHVEKGLGFHGLDDGTGLVGLLVLLLLLDLLLGWVLGLVSPRDGCSLNSLHLILGVGLVDDLEREDLLGEVLILAEVELDCEGLAGLGVGGIRLLLLALNVAQVVLENGLVLLLDQLKDHLVVLDGTVPEVGNALLSLEVLYINCLHLFLLLRLLSGLLLGEVLSVVGLKLGIVSCELSLVGSELSHGTLYDLLSDLIQGALLLKNLGLNGFDFQVELVR